MKDPERRALEKRIAELERELAETKQLAETFRLKMEDFNRFLDLLPQPVFEVNPEGKLTYSNQKAFDLFGNTWEDIRQGLNAFDVIAPEDRPRLMENIRLRTEGMIGEGTEYMALKKTGERFPVFIYSVPIVTEEGTIAFRGLIVDISGLKQAEEALRASEKRYHEIFDLIPISIWEYDYSEALTILDEIPAHDRADLNALFDRNPDLLKRFITSIKLCDVNNETVLLYGARSKEAVFAGYGKHLLPEARRTYRDVAVAYLSGKRYVRTETVNETHDGKRIDIILQVAFTKRMKESGRALVTALNVTEQKNAERALSESERKFRSIVEQSMDGITVVDEDGCVSEWNPGIERITGITREEAVDMPVWDMMFRTIPEKRKTPGQIPAYRQIVQQILLSGIIPAGMKLMEMTIRRPDGSCRIIQQVTSPVKTVRGHTIIITTRDVTELKQIEEERLKTGKLESVGLLAGGIAHDFNNILVSVLGNISLAKNYLGERHPGHELLVKAEKAGFRARDLTRQLLTFSKGGSPVKDAASICEIIRDSVEFSLSGSNVKCELSLPETLPHVNVDRGQMIQVMNNLVLNADQAMPDGGIIRISAESLRIESDGNFPVDPGEYVVVTVRDTGIGIPVDVLPKIFDPYFTTKTDGSGLGLSIVYSIIRNHGGHIDAESEGGAGAVFRICIPAGGVLPETTERNDIRLPDIPGRILVMDDEPGVREIAAEMLAHLGHEVETAANGEEAVAHFRKAAEEGCPFDAVILDLTIPGGMGGKTAVKMLLDLDPNARVIVSSGYSEDSLLANYSVHGFRGVITKPYRIEELRDEVNRVMNGKAER